MTTTGGNGVTIYLVIGLVVLMIVAPILRILPSAQQKAVMAIRRQAMAAGVQVDIVRIDDPDPDQEKYRTGSGRRLEPILTVTAYRKATRRSDSWRKEIQQDWQVQRIAGTSAADATGRWQSAGDTAVARLPAAKRAALEQALQHLPEDVVQVEERSGLLTVFWEERSGEQGLAAVLDFLSEVAAIVVLPGDDPV